MEESKVAKIVILSLAAIVLLWYRSDVLPNITSISKCILSDTRYPFRVSICSPFARESRIGLRTISSLVERERERKQSDEREESGEEEETHALRRAEGARDRGWTDEPERGDEAFGGGRVAMAATPAGHSRPQSCRGGRRVRDGSVYLFPRVVAAARLSLRPPTLSKTEKSGYLSLCLTFFWFCVITLITPRALRSSGENQPFLRCRGNLCERS